MSITVTQHDANEWHRLATDAYKTGRNDFGHRFSMAAACLSGKTIATSAYDTLQTIYRRWLVGGWAEVEQPR